MDKSTLSNYGWIVIAVLVLSVMIALATPFGRYIEQAVWSTTEGLFDTSEKALNVVGMSATPKNRLLNNKAVFFGDSICKGSTPGGDSAYVENPFSKIITDKNNMDYQNYGTNGYTISNTYRKMFSSTVASSLSTMSDKDYVIVEGFINDVILETPLGVLSDMGTTTFDETTFIGQLEQLIVKYNEKGYKAKLGFVMIRNVPCSDASIIRQYWDAAISVFEKYDVNYIDLYSKDYPLHDNCHPNELGHKQMAEDIEPWMNSF